MAGTSRLNDSSYHAVANPGRVKLMLQLEQRMAIPTAMATPEATPDRFVKRLPLFLSRALDVAPVERHRECLSLVLACLHQGNTCEGIAAALPVLEVKAPKPSACAWLEATREPGSSKGPQPDSKSPKLFRPSQDRQSPLGGPYA